MQVAIKKNIVLSSLQGKKFLVDVFRPIKEGRFPVIVFAHGFKGFKDWGTFDLIARSFAESGFIFVKFNFSHNGTTPENPEDFNDLDAFSNNNFTIEMDDLGTVIDWVFSDLEFLPESELDNDLYLIGHSRGGGIVILKAAEDKRVKKLITWSAVNEFGRFWDEQTKTEWKEKGIMYVRNARTNQDMPMKYQIYDNYYSNLDRLHIPTAVEKINIPFLIVHGDKDEAVSINAAKELKKLNPHADLFIVENGDHTYGGKQPWVKDQLPEQLQKVIDKSIRFLSS